MIDGDLLGSHPLCGTMARAVVYPRDSIAVRCLGYASDFIPVETLPPRLRDRLGLRSTISTRIRIRVIRKLLPGLFHYLPSIIKFYPEYRRAVRMDRVREPGHQEAQ